MWIGQILLDGANGDEFRWGFYYADATIAYGGLILAMPTAVGGGPFALDPKTGDVVWIPPGQKHWHGASPGSPMTHIAVQEQRDGKTAEWFEKVTDEQYGLSAPTAPPVANKNSRAQQLFGEIAPKFAELTDEVLYADIWERQGLSKRDRSLITVSALIAMNRPDQLRSHIGLARQNGLATIAKDVLVPK